MKYLLRIQPRKSNIGMMMVILRRMNKIFHFQPWHVIIKFFCGKKSTNCLRMNNSYNEFCFAFSVASWIFMRYWLQKWIYVYEIINSTNSYARLYIFLDIKWSHGSILTIYLLLMIYENSNLKLYLGVLKSSKF